MKILMLKAAADPERVLLRGKVYDLSNAAANELIEAEAAEKIQAEDVKPYHEPPSMTPRET